MGQMKSVVAVVFVNERGRLKEKRREVHGLQLLDVVKSQVKLLHAQHQLLVR